MEQKRKFKVGDIVRLSMISIDDIFDNTGTPKTFFFSKVDSESDSSSDYIIADGLSIRETSELDDLTLPLRKFLYENDTIKKSICIVCAKPPKNVKYPQKKRKMRILKKWAKRNGTYIRIPKTAITVSFDGTIWHLTAQAKKVE